MSQDVRPVLNYMGAPVRDRADSNLPAVASITCGICAILFLFGMCAGIWRTFVPLAGTHAGLIEMLLGASAVINGAVGALKAPRDSKWYNISLIGYASGVFIWTLCPIFFLL